VCKLCALFPCVNLCSQYLEGLIERRPDSTASELCQGLYEGMQIDVNESTITRALRNRGYSFKKVCTLTAHIL
jgi:transposase